MPSQLCGLAYGPGLSPRFLICKMGGCTFGGFWDAEYQNAWADFGDPFLALKPGSAKFLLCSLGKWFHLSDPCSLTKRAGILTFTLRVDKRIC